MSKDEYLITDKPLDYFRNANDSGQLFSASL